MKITDLLPAVNVHLPAQVTGVAFTDPVLTLYGDEWGMNLMTRWVGVIKGRQLDSEDDTQDPVDRQAIVESFVGGRLLAVEARSPNNDADPRFVFDDAVIDVIGLDPVDPWYLRIQDTVIVGWLDERVFRDLHR